MSTTKKSVKPEPIDSQSESYLSSLLDDGKGSFSLTGILEYKESFGKAHVFSCGKFDVTIFGRSGDYAVGNFCGQLCELTGTLETREHNGRFYPSFVVKSCWPFRNF